MPTREKPLEPHVVLPELKEVKNHEIKSHESQYEPPDVTGLVRKINAWLSERKWETHELRCGRAFFPPKKYSREYLEETVNIFSSAWDIKISVDRKGPQCVMSFKPKAKPLGPTQHRGRGGFL